MNASPCGRRTTASASVCASSASIAIRVGQNSPSRSTVISVIEPDFRANGHPQWGVFSRTQPDSPTGCPRASGRDNRGITRPKVLVITPHPVIGAGIETVLRLEDIYDVLRVGTLAEGLAQARDWPADAALVDGVLVEGGLTAIGIPCYVLSGDAESGQRLGAAIPTARGWLLKDAPPARLMTPIDYSLGIVRVGTDVRGTLGTIAAVVIQLAFITALGLFIWRNFLH